MPATRHRRRAKRRTDLGAIRRPGRPAHRAGLRDAIGFGLGSLLRAARGPEALPDSFLVVATGIGSGCTALRRRCIRVRLRGAGTARRGLCLGARDILLRSGRGRVCCCVSAPSASPRQPSPLHRHLRHLHPLRQARPSELGCRGSRSSGAAQASSPPLPLVPPAPRRARRLLPPLTSWCAERRRAGFFASASLLRRAAAASSTVKPSSASVLSSASSKLNSRSVSSSLIPSSSASCEMSSSSTHPISPSDSPSGAPVVSTCSACPCPRPRPRPPRRRRRRRGSASAVATASESAASAVAGLRSGCPSGSAAAVERLRRLPRSAPDGAGSRPSLMAAMAALATDGDASRKPNSGVTSFAGISGALMPRWAFASLEFRPIPAIFMMSMNSSVTAIRSDEVFGRKLITSQRTPFSCSARIAGAKSPSPETMTAMSIRSARRNRSTTSSMSRLALTRPSPNLRMSLVMTL